MKLKIALSCVTAVVLSAVAGAADVLYVDINDPNASDEAGEGRGTEALPYATIQAAVAAAQEDWTVLVKPGVYTNGAAKSPSSSNPYQSNRVMIDKRIRLESTAGAAKTEIRGCWKPGGTYGSGAIRAVYIAATAEGTVVKGFTIADSATQNDIASHDHGGGVFAEGCNAFVVDCAITGCTAAKGGGALCGGTAIRTLFDNNYSGTWEAGSIEKANLWNCVVREKNYASGYRTFTNVTNVNCTYVTANYLRVKDCAFYNSLICSYGADQDDGGNTYESTVTKAATHGLVQCHSPWTGDFRLLDTSDAISAAQTSYVRSVFPVPDEFATTDFAGNPLDTAAATCAAGAVQTAVAPICGSLKDTGTALLVDGSYVPANAYFRPATYPAQMRVTLSDGKAPAILGSEVSTPYLCFYPHLDGAALVMVSPDPTAADSTWSSSGVTRRWVDDEKGDDESGTGAEDAPFKTIQAAIDSLGNASYSVISVAPGTYATGGKEVDGVFCRLSADMSGGRVVRIVAPEGPEKTMIVGTTDGSSECRLAHRISGSVVVQGFTLTGGRVAGEHTSAVSAGATLLDCIVSNNVSETSLCNATSVYRCRFRNNTCVTALLDGGFSLAFSSFYGNTAGNLFSSAGNPRMFNCTLSGNVTPEGSPHYAVSVNLGCNNIVDANGCTFQVYSHTDMAQNILWNYVPHPNGLAKSDNFIVIDPQLADPAAGDHRLMITSPAWTAGSIDGSVYPQMKSFYKYAQGDVLGRPLVFQPDNRMTMGCNHYDQVNVAEVVEPFGGLRVTGAKIGLNVVEPGASLTFTVAQGGESPRSVIGIVANGTETNLFADAASYSFTVNDANPAVRVEALYSPDWYVDAVNGNDANDGFTPETAKLTLADAVTNAALTAGDVIHALPGTYETGYMVSAADEVTRSRVVVPAGVSLVSTDGKEATVIKGAIAEEEEGRAADGCGFGATRCVCLGPNARLEGFTLQGGRTTAAYESAPASNFYGAGVRAKDETARIVDCHFVDCRGGATGYRGTYVRCRADSCGRASAYVFDMTVLVSCIVNRSTTGSPVRDSVIHNCICRPDYGYYSVAHDGGTGKTVEAYNSVFYGPLASVNATYVNCVCITNAGEHNLWGDCMRPGAAGTETLLFTNSADIALTDYRPMTADHPFVDAGDNALLPEGDDARLDIAGAPRAMNRRVDLGAYEWDIRPDLAADLGRKATVDFITANVVENGGTVLLDGDGARLEATLAARAGQSRGQTVTVTGTGVLKVYLNGTLVAEKGAGTWDLDFGKLAASNALVYVVEGDATAEFAGTKSREGLLLLFR